MTSEQVTYNIIILHPMQVNILISIKQHHQLFHFGVTPSYGRTVSMSGIVNLFDCCITVSIVLLQRQVNISWLHHGLRHINNNNISSLVSRPAYGCPTNEFSISWLWTPQINFTIHPSHPKTDFARNLNGHPLFLLSVHVLIKSFFLGLYSPLLSQAINRNEALPLTPVLVSDLIITTTNPMSWATDRAQCKTSSRLVNNYNAIQKRSEINKHLYNIITISTIN